MMKYLLHSMQTLNEAIFRSKTVNHPSSRRLKMMFSGPSRSILNVASIVTETISLALVRILKTNEMSRKKVSKTSKM